MAARLPFLLFSVGVLATTLGAMEQFSLSRTGITVGDPKAQIIRLSGDLRVRAVQPDVVITAPIIPGDSEVVLEQALFLFKP